jgi:hypothetical protein
METVLLRTGHKPGTGYTIGELVVTLAGTSANVSPVVAAYSRGLNDRMPFEPRQRLKEYAARLIGTAGSAALEQRRAFICADYALRRFAPRALRVAGAACEARELAALPPVSAATAGTDCVEGNALELAASVSHGHSPEGANACTAVKAALFATASATGKEALDWLDAADAAAEAALFAEAVTGEWDTAFELLERLLQVEDA